MKVKITKFFLCCAVALHAQPQQFSVSVSNPLKTARTDVPVVIPLQQRGEVTSALVSIDGQETPCQLNDLDQDGLMDELCFVVNLGPRQHLAAQVTLNDGPQHAYPARVYAEMVIRNDKVKEKNKHNNYVESITARGDCANSYNLLHHHGVCFESELNGIRIYFDKRQTLDLYGKFHRRLELQATQFYTSAQQKEQGYGDDVLWVGNTFGLGAFRGWDGTSPTMVEPVSSRTQRIIAYGPVCTIVEVVDKGWQADPLLPPVDMTLRYRQWAGHRDTDVQVTFSHDVTDYQFSTGIINVKGSVEHSNGKGLRACWGTDYPAADTLTWKRETVGLGICVPRQYVKREVPASDGAPADGQQQGGNYTLVVGTRDQSLDYRVAYCSANEDFGFHSAEEWFQWTDQWYKEQQHPVLVEYQVP